MIDFLSLIPQTAPYMVSGYVWQRWSGLGRAVERRTCSGSLSCMLILPTPDYNYSTGRRLAISTPEQDSTCETTHFNLQRLVLFTLS